MASEFSFTVISDTHYFSKKNWVDGYKKDLKPKNDQLFFSASEEIVNYTFDSLCKNDTPQTVLISGDLTYNAERTSAEEMKKALLRLKQNGKKVYVITSTHDYYTPHMPTFGINKFGEYIEVDSVKREELLNYYGEFGYNDALSVHEKSMSYVSQLSEGYRLLALNDDYGDPDCGYSDDCFEWIKKQVLKAHNDGQFVIAMTHHPLVPPSPVFTAVAKGDMLNKYELRAKQFSEMGIDFIFTGHTHMHNISSTEINGKKFYDISTAALTGFPPFYREAHIDGAKRKMDIKTIRVNNVPGLDTGNITLTDYTKNLFLGTVSEALYNAEHDYEKFKDFAVGISIPKDTSEKYKFVFKSAAKFLNRLTFGKVWRFVRRSSGVSKDEIRRLYNKKVVPFAIDIAANLYRGDGNTAKSSTEYKITYALLKKADKLAKPFSAKLKKIGLTSISETVLPLVCKEGMGDAEAEIYF